MENKTIARTFRLFSQLMELYDENPFKVRSMANAAFKIDKLPFAIAQKSPDEMAVIDGIGKSTAGKIQELLSDGTIAELQFLLDQTPEGVLEIMSVKGLGPKKVKIIWKELGIESLGELLYACNENRLIEAKGFGLKTQLEIKNAIEFKIASNGCFLYAQIEAYATDLLQALKARLNTEQVAFTGQFRRCCEVITSLDILIAGTEMPAIDDLFPDAEISLKGDTELQITTISGLNTCIRTCPANEFKYQLFVQTGSEEHVQEVLKRISTPVQLLSEAEIYKAGGLAYIEPELREGLTEIREAENGTLPQLITFADLQGTLHNHSTWSDGVNTIKEMALFCRDELKLHYLGISDHSKSAFYANGLTEERVLAQQKEIDELNRELAPFRIFKGIESDILFDGSLDYPDEILATFDFVVASVHSVLKMNEEKATSRLIKAIENPFITILGHPTGRLLLSRSGYSIDYKKVIDACAANGVVMEINANPLRLDLDWRWHRYATEKGVLLSINPDAHRTSGFYDMHYGILAARKGGVSASNCLNAFSLDKITAFFNR
ncbi:DNA polymerase/3'-5' exonuclease PolX [Pedobacter sp. BS3]|uniref:DNA polymerase/3'-5' exonuclease PolX n=1 Tax=Pedobacter sp. BS3 TaxID=2567937 RepID=UPI0011ED60C7|nr:DNA polymerase/3'-5' exonuclease PolX [Pedobacter sp. BS3]TZF82688.1 DNA polymerase/3'-5' exonuclease PolX [Pedobacter sp. BS3]